MDEIRRLPGNDKDATPKHLTLKAFHSWVQSNVGSYPACYPGGSYCVSLDNNVLAMHAHSAIGASTLVVATMRGGIKDK